VDVWSVWMESDGKRLVRRRLDAGGLREGDAFVLRERPVGVLRAGGRKEGGVSLLDMIFSIDNRFSAANVD